MIFYCCANNKNIGDYFSMLGIKKLIGIEGKDIFMNGDIIAFKEQLGQIKKDDILIIGGGGLLKDHFKKYWDEVFKIKNNNIYIIGIGVCDIKNKNTVIDDDYLTKIKNIAKLIMLRPVIPKQLDGADEIFCPSNFYFSSISKEKNIENSSKILYISHAKLVGEYNNEKIKNKITEYCHNNNFEYKEYNNMFQEYSISDIYNIYNDNNFIFTTRLHGLILGHSIGKKIISISNDYKIEGYCNKIKSKNIYSIDNFLKLDILHILNLYKKPAVSSADINLSFEKIKDLKWQIDG